MKVLIIGADPSFRGDINKVENKFNFYLKQGHEITIVDMLTGVPSIITDSKIKFYCFGGKNKFFALVNHFVGIYKIYKEKKSKGETFDVVTSQDLIYTGLLGLFAAKLFRINLVPQVHGDYVDNPLWLKQSKLRHIENRICKFVLSRVKFVRTVSNRIAKDLEKYTKDKTVLSSPIGTSFSAYFPQSPLPEKRNKQLLFVGRLIEEKNPYLFCEIAKQVVQMDSEFKIVIAGSGIMQKELEKFFLDNKVNQSVTFHGQCGSEKLRELYQDSLCYVHTALWEGWGMPMIESIASGCPVITTDSGCVGEAVLDGLHGFVCEPNARDFVDKIFELEKNPDLQKEFAINGIRDSKNWELDYQTKQFLEILDYASKK